MKRTGELIHIDTQKLGKPVVFKVARGSVPPPLLAARHPVRLQRRPLPERLGVLVKIEARSLEVLHDPRREFPPNVQALTDATENATTSKLAPPPAQAGSFVDPERTPCWRGMASLAPDNAAREGLVKTAPGSCAMGVFQPGEVAVPRALFGDIMRRIDRLRLKPLPT